jgi:1-acyl-sn-glycerol-3-phosphate acyltransferase
LRVVCGTGRRVARRRKAAQGRLHRRLQAPIGCGRHSRCTPSFDDPTFILKRELMWIPLFGWYIWKAGLIPIDRGAGLAALARMTTRARKRWRSRRGSSSSFPKARGGRRAPSRTTNPASLLFTARPACLRSGRAQFRTVLAAALAVPFPGTIVVEILDPIAPGLDRETFFSTACKMSWSETASAPASRRWNLFSHPTPDP